MSTGLLRTHGPARAAGDVLARLTDALRAFHIREGRLRDAAAAVAEAAAQGHGVLLIVDGRDEAGPLVRVESSPHLPAGTAYVIHPDALGAPGGR